jgi:predicted transposase YbfD/YdcC
MTVTLDSTPHSRSKDPASILEHFAALPDPRRDHGKVHMLDEIVFMSICAVLCGADSWQEIADYSRSKHDWLTTFLTLPGGIPSHDTFRRVFCLLDPLAFQGCFSNWMTALMDRHGLISIPVDQSALKPIAIDGKTQRGSARRTIGQSPLHMVSAWSVENHLTLGQVATNAKSNESTAIPELLKLLDLEGAVVTIDAMGCQKDIAAGIVQGGGEYVLAVKENQPHLYEDIQKAFDEALEHGEPGVDFTEFQTEEVNGSRHETRTCCVIKNPSGIRNAGLWISLTAGLTHHNRLSWKSGKNLRLRLVVYSRAGVKDGEFDFLG